METIKMILNMFMLYLLNYKIFSTFVGESNEKAYDDHGNSLIGCFRWNHCF